jgi:hypothetical protein
MKTLFGRLSLALTLIVLGLSVANPFPASQQARSTGQMVPANAEFLSDTSGGAFRSDGLGAYIDGKSQCLTANVSSAGYFYLRTVVNGCRTKTPRSIWVDLSAVAENEADCVFNSCQTLDDDFGQPGTLNNCGPNLLPDVTIRAQSLFANPIPSSQLTPVQIEINLSPDFRNTAFYLNGAAYIQLGSNPNERVLTTGADRSHFALVMIKKNGDRVCMGMYDMPFTIKVTKGL